MIYRDFTRTNSNWNRCKHKIYSNKHTWITHFCLSKNQNITQASLIFSDWLLRMSFTGISHKYSFNLSFRAPTLQYNQTQSIRRILPTNCLSVFDHFVELGRKRSLNHFTPVFHFQCRWGFFNLRKFKDSPLLSKFVVMAFSIDILHIHQNFAGMTSWDAIIMTWWEVRYEITFYYDNLNTAINLYFFLLHFKVKWLKQLFLGRCSLHLIKNDLQMI